MSEQSDLLREVADVVAGKRNKSYGSPKVNLDERTSELWNAYLGQVYNGINGIDVCNMMILLKIARTMEDPTNKDSWADIAGYAGAAWEIVNDYIIGRDGVADVVYGSGVERTR